MATPLSPKVTASAVSGVIAAAILANITLITPDLFDGMGKWSGLVYGLVIAIASAVAGWLKSDPLRTPWAAADASPVVASGVVPTEVTAPTLPEVTTPTV